jgi:hypothetical protein
MAFVAKSKHGPWRLVTSEAQAQWPLAALYHPLQNCTLGRNSRSAPVLVSKFQKALRVVLQGGIPRAFDSGDQIRRLLNGAPESVVGSLNTIAERFPPILH